MRYRTDLIKAPKTGDDRFFGDVNTKGIIDVVLYADPKCGEYTMAFAKTLSSAKLFDSCRNIHDFVKTQIPYVLDKTGYQWIKSPGRLWKEKAGDCKSFSVFIASCLKNLGITYGYRFASYDPDDPTPTHVYIYVPVKGQKEIIVDAVWSGPFNSEKQYAYKHDYLMAKTHYLGATGKHIPGVLQIDTPIDQLTDGELDLLLMKQRLEIKKMNAGIGGIGNYDEVLKTIDHCIRNVGNPDMIIGIGKALEEGYSLEEAISGIGKNAKKKETGKTAAGRLLQKVGKGLKNAGKAVLKVVTLPMKLVLKGAMEIYIPKAAPLFLYLFAPNPDTLPDMMKRKRKKAEKFKNFVVKGLGMKDAHFMQIVSNNLEKRYKMPPAQYLASKLANRVSGIGNPKARWRNECDTRIAGISGPGPTRKQVKPKPVRSLKPAAKPKFNSTLKTYMNDSGNAAAALHIKAPNFTAVKEKQAELQEKAQAKAASKGEAMNTLTDLGAKAASGDVVGAIMGAITWLINKISALFGGKEKMEPITADDLPDIERDAANAFEFQDLNNDYKKLDHQQKELVKVTVAEAIAKDMDEAAAQKYINEKLPFLDSEQRFEMLEEVKTGAEALDEKEGTELAKEIDKGAVKDNTGLIALAAVAVFALAK